VRFWVPCALLRPNTWLIHLLRFRKVHRAEGAALPLGAGRKRADILMPGSGSDQTREFSWTGLVRASADSGLKVARRETGEDNPRRDCNDLCRYSS